MFVNNIQIGGYKSCPLNKRVQVMKDMEANLAKLLVFVKNNDSMGFFYALQVLFYFYNVKDCGQFHFYFMLCKGST